MVGRYAALSLFCVLWTGALAQPVAAPTVRFTLDFPASNPLHYEVSIFADGHGSYSSQTRPDADSTSSVDPAHDAIETYQTEFTASPSTAARIFELARQAHYFEGSLDSGKNNMAFMGAKTLGYDAPGHSTHAAYNYSSLPAVRQLTEIFQDLSAALDFGRRLDHDLHYQKLALEDELKRLEEMVNEGHLQGIFPLVPLLQKIVDDPAIVNVSRSRAQRLLAKAGGK
jgi:hypothetical protein